MHYLKRLNTAPYFHLQSFLRHVLTHWPDGRWGNKLSNKLFMGKEFVVKHIRLKHAARMEQELSKVCFLPAVQQCQSQWYLLLWSW